MGNAALNDSTEKFSAIYRGAAWESRISRSGIGSEPRKARAYVKRVNRFIADRGPSTIVDFGCGDMSVASLLNLGNARYTGVDIVEDAIEDNVRRFPEHRFIFDDIVDCELSPADLMLCKDVLQHLPNDDVARFLRTQAAKFRWSIITNDIEHYRVSRLRLRRELIGVTNSDIEAGAWRPLDLKAAPFRLDCEELGRYRVRHGERVWVKQMLLLQQ